MSEKKEYIERGAALKAVEGAVSSENVIDNISTIPAADVEPVVRCVKCKYGTPLKAHADGVYGLHCAIGRGEEVGNVWHKYSKHYEDYSLVDVDGFCDQGEAGEPVMERSGSDE